MKSLKSILIGLLFVCLCLSTAANARVLVLVPGYFGTLMPSDFSSGWKTPYWSQDIIRVYENAGYRVFVANNFNSIGSFEENGRHLIDYLNYVHTQMEPGESLQVITHSSGALYALYATDHSELIPGIVVQKMITVSAPFNGVEFIDSLSKDLPVLTEVEKWIDMTSLNQLRPSLVQNFLKTLHAPPSYPIISYTGDEPRGYKVWDAAFLSGVFYLTEEFMTEPSDGIVTARSATSRAGFLGESPKDEYIHLDHWKQVADADFFILMGMTNTNYIRKEQIRFYTELLKKLD